jgi:hypothetical protein
MPAFGDALQGSHPDRFEKQTTTSLTSLLGRCQDGIRNRVPRAALDRRRDCQQLCLAGPLCISQGAACVHYSAALLSFHSTAVSLSKPGLGLNRRKSNMIGKNNALEGAIVRVGSCPHRRATPPSAAGGRA